jgi:amino-acid N-acetyltransferase
MNFSVRAARTSDVPLIQALVEPLVQRRILLGKDSVVFYEAIQEFRVAEDAEGNAIGCGALHVMWQDLGEVRTLAVTDEWLHRGVGHALLEQLEEDARALGLSRLFCLSFEVPFFTRHGFEPMTEEPIDPAIYLARVKPNTLGNTRMIKRL